MSRWPSNGTARLQQAALDLFAENGFERTAVADIAARAGLTERTFFRHFADKREVLFWGSNLLQEAMVAALDEAPAAASPFEAVGTALIAAGTAMQDRLDFARRRHAVISATPELQERELMKMARLSTALRERLEHRGVDGSAAQLTADAGIAVFRVSFAAWVSGDGRELAAIMAEKLAELSSITAGR